MVAPICVFDIRSDGSSAPVEATDLGAAPAAGFAYRWIHLDLGDPDIGAWLRTHLPSTPAAALLEAETRPRCDAYEDGLILNLRGVNLNPDQEADDMVSLRLWASGTTIVSARIRKLFAVDALRQDIDAGRAPTSVSHLLTRLARGLTDRIENALLNLEDRTDGIEEAALSKSDAPNQDIILARRSAIRFRRYVGPQRDALAKLASVEGPLISKADRGALREIANRTTRAVEALDAVRDRLGALQDYVDVNQTAKLGRNSYVLSVVAAIFLPLSFVTGLFGVNVGGMPGADHPYGFLALAVAMAAFAVLLLVVFRRIKWL